MPEAYQAPPSIGEREHSLCPIIVVLSNPPLPPRACTRGKAIGSIVVIVVMSTIIAVSLTSHGVAGDIKRSKMIKK